ncbi:glucosaminidase domain-containing protein [uncultured Akkermansia sp.]|uniref:glucosaminidase domain-containing protein n=1 Tax=uncultured Akkermansia sp. TaxID=512294 RepID=UPI002616ED76|nr:glucosaminidase domain-containing protein [uncultured Akkermansia sp.]
MSRELPLYQGATPQTPQQQMQGPGFTPHVQPMGGMLDAAVQAGLGAGEQYAELKDFGASQQAEHQRRVHDQQMRKEFESRLRLPWGSEGSFYDSEGNRREDEVNAFIIKWQEKNNGIPRPFWLEKNAMRDEGDLMQANDALASRVELMTLDAEAKNRKQAFQDNYDLAVEQEDWPGVHRVIDRAVEAGQITRARGDEMRLKVDKTSALHHFKNLAATNPGGAYDFLDSDYCQSLFAPYERDEMRRNSARKARPAAADSFFSSFVLTRKKGKGTSGTKDDGPEWTGFYTARECGWIRAFQAGRADEARPQIAAAAAEEARAFNPSLSEEQSEVARDAFIQKYSRFGLDKEWLSRQWGDADRMRKELKTPTIDVKGRLDFLEKRGALLNQGAFNAENQPYSNEDGWKSGGKFRDEFMGQLGLTGTETAQKAKDKYMAYARANHAAGLRAQVSERFHSWRTTEGKDASQAEQQAKLITTVREITGNRDVSFVDKGVDLMDSRIESARDAQRTKFYQWAAKNVRKFWVDSTEREAPMQRVRLGFDSSRKDLPAGVLLPKSIMEGGDQKNAVVEATFDNEHFRRFRVVGTCEGDAPVMTYAVAREGFYDVGRSFAVDIRVLQGDGDQLMKEQEAALPAGKSVKLNKSALGGLAPYGQAFIDAGRKYGMTPDQVKIGMSIAMHETGRGSSHAFRNKNNSMGISPNGGGPRSFGSVEEGIDYGMRNLKRNYFDKGLTTIEQIGAVYAPIGADNDPRNLNQHWVKGVRKYRSFL